MTTISRSQNRFLATNDLTPVDDTTLWCVQYLTLLTLRSVPLEIKLVATDGTSRADPIILYGRGISYDLGDARSFKLNSGITGFCEPFLPPWLTADRVAYESRRLATLGKEASSGLYTADDRIGLVSDAFALSEAGISRTSSTLGRDGPFHVVDDLRR
jgi:aminopeptidase 2